MHICTYRNALRRKYRGLKKRSRAITQLPPASRPTGDGGVLMLRDYSVFALIKAREKVKLLLGFYQKQYHNRFYGVVVSTLDFESSDLGSTPGRTFFFLCILF